MESIESFKTDAIVNCIGKEDPIVKNGKSESNPHSWPLIRLGKSSDVPGILELFSNHADENLHLRSPNFIKKMIEREFVILMECEDGTVGAYLEICFFISYGGN